VENRFTEASKALKNCMTSIIIKPAVKSDAADLIQANINSRSYHAPWTQPFTDIGGFDEWFSGLGSGTNVGLIARDLQSGGIVGVTNLSQIFRRGFQNAYLGFYGMASYTRRGLMTEAVRLTANYAFAELGLHRVEANIQPENAASIALARRVGFRKEGFSPRYLQIGGVWRDHERWALLADDPRSSELQP
jgi:ribosomal-protein-alanine N-acetyltransferase